MQTWTIVVAAGSGARFGGAKQFRTVGSERLVDRAVDTASRVTDGVVIVLPAGETWTAGLAAVPLDVDIVVVHDAARPLADEALFRLVIHAVTDGVDGAIPALAVSDTIKRVDDGRVIATVPRDDLVSVQTPQAFRAATLRAAHAGGAEGTDDAALVEAVGGTVVIVAGNASNLKVTGPEDLMLVRALLALRSPT